VLIVDDGSTDAGLNVVRSYQDRLPIEILTLPHQGLRPARATGFDAIDTELCAIFDADETLYSDCLERLVRAMDDTSVALACGHKSPIEDGWVSSGAAVLRDLMTGLRAGPETWAAIGGVMVFRTQVVRGLGGLARDHEVAEDTELSWRLRSHGYRLATVRDAVVSHPDPNTLKGQFLQHLKIGRRMVHTFQRHPNMALRWESWARFFSAGLLAGLAVRPHVGVLASIAAFGAFEWKVRRAPFSRTARLFAFPVLVVQSLGWTVGFLAEPFLHARGKRTTD
jgi:cellulose synthase/poly-beta-1,6-N-acetylglucosamine synthase-like glycosyltransferase